MAVFAATLALACLATMAQSCQGGGSDGDLRGRVQEYLELRQKQDWPAIYERFLDPEVREKVGREAFLKVRKGGLDILGFSVLDLRTEEDKGTVRVRLDAQIAALNPQGGKTMLRKDLDDPQEWVRRDGRWYIRLKG